MHLHRVATEAGSVVDDAFLDGLDHRLQARQGGSQVVRDGSHQVTSRGLDVALALHGLLQLGRHVVEGDRQRVELPSAVQPPDPGVEVSPSQGPRRLRQSGNRARSGPGQGERRAHSRPGRVQEQDAERGGVVVVHEHLPGQDDEVGQADHGADDGHRHEALSHRRAGEQRAGHRDRNQGDHECRDHQRRQVGELARVHPHGRTGGQRPERADAGHHEQQREPSPAHHGSNR